MRQQTQSRRSAEREPGALPRAGGVAPGRVHTDVVSLQRSAGNAAVGHLLAGRAVVQRQGGETTPDGGGDGGAPALAGLFQQAVAFQQQAPGVVNAVAQMAPAPVNQDDALAALMVAMQLAPAVDQQIAVAEQQVEVEQAVEGQDVVGQEQGQQPAAAGQGAQKTPFFDGDWSKGLGNAGAGIGLILQIAGTYSGNQAMTYAGAGLSGLAGAGDAISEIKKLITSKNMNIGKFAGGVLGATGAGTLAYAASAVPAGMSAATFVSPARTAGLTIAVAGVLTKALGEAKKWEECWPFRKEKQPDLEAARPASAAEELEMQSIGLAI